MSEIVRTPDLVPAVPALRMLLMGWAPALFITGLLTLVTLGWMAFGPVAAAGGLLVLYVVPPLASRVFRPGPGSMVQPHRLGEPGFLRWWWSLQCEVIFNRFPVFEEALRLVPGLYSTWLRLWGAKIGRRVYWSSGTHVVDRPHLTVGDRTVFGMDSSVIAHAITRDEDGHMILFMAPVTVGRDCVVGARASLAPSSSIPDGTVLRGHRLVLEHARDERPWLASARTDGEDTQEQPHPPVSSKAPIRLLSRARAQWRLKVWLSFSLTLLFCLGYYPLQHLAEGRAVTLQPTPVDVAIPFGPHWAWAYQSLYLLLAIVPWLTTSRHQLRVYALGFVLLCVACFASFAIYPVEVLRPESADGSQLLALIWTVDGPGNAFPSLHVGFATLCLFLAAMGSKPMPRVARLTLLGALSVWVLVIGYSTIATRQHYFVDALAGAFVATIAHHVSVRLLTTPGSGTETHERTA